MIDLSTYYKEHFPELFDLRSVVGVSGGLDSTVLLRSLVDSGADVIAAHVNYRLRGNESDGDEAFLRELCDRLEVPLHVMTIDLEKGSGLQERARNVRYEWFDKVVGEEDADLILTAHHEDDQVETVYFHLTRGSGMHSLAGIPIRRDSILRPLLGLSRDEIWGYAQHKGWEWREDTTNSSNSYMRNKIRNEILPELEKEDRGIRDELLELAGLAGYINEQNERNFEEFSVDHIAHGENREEILVEQLINGYDEGDILYRWLTPKGFTAGTIRRIGESLDASTGSRFPGPDGEVVLDRAKLIYTEGEIEEIEVVIDKEDEKVEISGNEMWIEEDDVPQEFNNDATEIFVDQEKLVWPLRIRNWREGDRMTILGMQGTKKVSDILVDEKISVADKREVLVLEGGDEIVWLVGIRQSDAHKVSPETEAAVRIKFSKMV